MSSGTSAIDTLIQSDLWREFEKTARNRRRRPVELLADVIAEFLETQEGVGILDDIRADIRTSYSEDDAVDIVKSYRSSRRR